MKTLIVLLFALGVLNVHCAPTENDDFKAENPTEIAEEYCEPSTEDMMGPFYKPDMAENYHICVRYENFTILPKINMTGYVKNDKCEVLSGAKIEIWQADHDGGYHDDNTCRGYIISDENGFFSFETIHPGRYIVYGRFRPAHIHMFVTMPGHRSLVTQIYFKGDPYLGKNDVCPPPYCHSDDPTRVVALNKADSAQNTNGNVDLVLESEH